MAHRVNPLVEAIPPSLIRAINAKKRPGDIDLGLGEPTLRPDAAPFEAAMAWVRENGCPYSPNAGYESLREQVAAYLGFPGAPNVCITVGSEEALYLGIKALIDPAKDEVLVVEPSYLAYAKICLMEGIRVRSVALPAADGFAPDAERVLAALGPDTRLIVLNSPSNPTGRIWPESELQRLAEGLAQRAEPVFVLSDEVYRELYFTPTPPPSIASYHPHSLVVGSLSKSNALTGLRLGWIAGPREVIAAAIKVHQFVNTAASTFSQKVAEAVFRAPGALGAHRPSYVQAQAALALQARQAGLTFLPPEGAFYCMVKLPESLAANSLAAAERLLEEERVVAVPGIAFGESAEGWLRLSWVTSGDRLAEGLARIGAFCRRHA
ncbi:MAG TPA: pyridoxal phosphate-dependent aminotransferase [Symbiobacteriaceae bacterium]|nr:pyridoxal phosphate-dependent aminotransferase [Symbiobacteriaceae bacterium]